MVDNKREDKHSQLLKAVADVTRRSLLAHLCQQGPSRVTNLASCYEMTLNAVSKHIKVLEKAGLITRKTIGKTHWIEVRLALLEEVENWFNELKSVWELRLNRLSDLVSNGDEKNE